MGDKAEFITPSDKRWDELYMLEGWVESVGAKAEYHYAVKLGKEIWFESQDEERK